MPGAIRTILVPHDFSAHSHAAYARAEQLARLSGASIHLLHVVNSPMLHAVTPAGPLHLALPDVVTKAARLEAAELLHEIASHSRCQVAVHVSEGLPADEICELAEEVAADLIVMGTHGREGLSNLLHGSVAQRTQRRARCAVLTVREPVEARQA
jgi:nucleotide-binding universal stress UspA family protein